MYPLTAAVIISNSDTWDEVQELLRQSTIRVVLELPGVAAVQDLRERLVNARPDVVLLDIQDLSRTEVSEFIWQIRKVPGEPEVIAVHREADAELILSAVRAGAAEYLHPPFAEPLKAALERIAGAKEKSEQSAGKDTPGGKAVAVLSAKGGCGATTISCHLAVNLHQINKQHVLLADLDLTAGIIRKLLQPGSRYSIVDATSNVQRLDATYWRALVSNGSHGVEVLAGPVEPLVLARPSAQSLRQVLRFVRSQYDWSVIDIGRGLASETVAVIEEVDETLLVTTMDVPSLHQAKRIIKCLSGSFHAKKSLRLVVNRVTKTPEISMEELQNILGMSVYATIPNDYRSLSEAYSEGRLLTGNSPLCRRLAGLAEKVAGVPAKPKKAWLSLFGS